MTKEDQIFHEQHHYELWCFLSWYVQNHDTSLEGIWYLKKMWPKKSLFCDAYTCFPCKAVLQVSEEQGVDAHCGLCPIFKKRCSSDCGTLYNSFVALSARGNEKVKAAQAAYALACLPFDWGRSSLPALD